MKGVVKAVSNERGVGLLMALLVLVAIGAIAVGLISSVATDRRLASYNSDRAKAMQFAEAGVYEAYERIRLGDVPSKANPNPKMVAQVFRSTTGAMPSVGTDTTAMATGQPAGEWLPYSSPTKGPDVLTIRYMTNAARTGVYRYDVTQTPPIQGKQGDPVFIINSPARVGLARAEIEATVAMQGLKTNLLGAWTADAKLDFNAPIKVYGQDYIADTPVGTGDAGGDNTYWSANPAIAAAWSTGDIKLGGGAALSGNPDAAKFKTGFYDGPWNVFNMSQDEFWSWVGPPNKQLKADLPRGIVYLGDPHDQPQKGHRKYSIKGGYGDGLLYVNGKLEVNGDFTFRGLIYVEDDMTIKGDSWILGGVVVAGNHGKVISQKKTKMTLLASKEAISQYVGQYGNPFVTLGWKEK